MTRHPETGLQSMANNPTRARLGIDIILPADRDSDPAEQRYRYHDITPPFQTAQILMTDAVAEK
jgi:hypothetical protein